MSRRRSPFLPLFFLALAAFAVWMFLAPSLTYRRIQKAADRGDVEALNEMVDFPALRTSVKENLRNAVSREISNDGDNPFAALGGVVASALAGPLVDAAVTPAGIAAMTRGEEPTEDGERETRAERQDVDKGYEGLNRWTVQYRDPETGDETVALVLRRDGLGWKLSGVRFGPDVE